MACMDSLELYCLCSAVNLSDTKIQYSMMCAYDAMLIFTAPDTNSMNAVFEFSGDRREVDLNITHVERKALEREETIVQDPAKDAGMLLHAGIWNMSLFTLGTVHMCRKGYSTWSVCQLLLCLNNRSDIASYQTFNKTWI